MEDLRYLLPDYIKNLLQHNELAIDYIYGLSESIKGKEDELLIMLLENKMLKIDNFEDFITLLEKIEINKEIALGLSKIYNINEGIGKLQYSMIKQNLNLYYNFKILIPLIYSIENLNDEFILDIINDYDVELIKSILNKDNFSLDVSNESKWVFKLYKMIVVKNNFELFILFVKQVIKLQRFSNIDTLTELLNTHATSHDVYDLPDLNAIIFEDQHVHYTTENVLHFNREQSDIIIFICMYSLMVSNNKKIIWDLDDIEWYVEFAPEDYDYLNETIVKNILKNANASGNVEIIEYMYNKIDIEFNPFEFKILWNDKYLHVFKKYFSNRDNCIICTSGFADLLIADDCYELINFTIETNNLNNGNIDDKHIIDVILESPNCEILFSNLLDENIKKIFNETDDWNTIIISIKNLLMNTYDLSNYYLFLINLIKYKFAELEKNKIILLYIMMHFSFKKNDSCVNIEIEKEILETLRDLGVYDNNYFKSIDSSENIKCFNTLLRLKKEYNL